MSPSLQRYLSEIASLHEKEIAFTEQKFKTHVAKYRLIKAIGQGSGGEVFLARHTETDEKAAIKIIRKSSKHPHWERMARQENSTMQYLARFPKENKHIVQHKMTVENAKEIAIVMEYAQGGDLFELVKRRGKLPESEAWRIFKQMIQAVKFIHGKGICHRDIQPCNVFLDKHHNVLVGDWGHSKTWTPFDTTQENCGSLCYAAPEVFLADKHYVGPEIDLWSCGTVLYVMLSGQRPFWSNKTSDIYQNIQAGRYKKLPDYLSPEVSHLLSILLSTDPLKRATIVDVLNHPWMKNHPTRVKRSDSSPFLLSPKAAHSNPACGGKYGMLKRQPHPLLAARKAKGVSCEQLDLSAFSSNGPSLAALRERMVLEKHIASISVTMEPINAVAVHSTKKEGDNNSDLMSMQSPPSNPTAQGKMCLLQVPSLMCDGGMLQLVDGALTPAEY